MDESASSPTPDFTALEEELFGALTPPSSSADSSENYLTNALPSAAPTLSASTPTLISPSVSAQISTSTSSQFAPSQKQPQLTLPSPPPPSSSLPLSTLTPEESANLQTNVSLLKSHLISNHILHLHNLSLLSTQRDLSQHLANEHALRISSDTSVSSLREEVAQLKEALEREKGARNNAESEREVLKKRLRACESSYKEAAAQVQQMEEWLADVKREKEVLEGVVRGFTAESMRPKTLGKEDIAGEANASAKAGETINERPDPQPETQSTKLTPQPRPQPHSQEPIIIPNDSIVGKPAEGNSNSDKTSPETPA